MFFSFLCFMTHLPSLDPDIKPPKIGEKRLIIVSAGLIGVVQTETGVYLLFPKTPPAVPDHEPQIYLNGQWESFRNQDLKIKGKSTELCEPPLPNAGCPSNDGLFHQGYIRKASDYLSKGGKTIKLAPGLLEEGQLNDMLEARVYVPYAKVYSFVSTAGVPSYFKFKRNWYARKSAHFVAEFVFIALDIAGQNGNPEWIQNLSALFLRNLPIGYGMESHHEEHIEEGNCHENALFDLLVYADANNQPIPLTKRYFATRTPQKTLCSPLEFRLEPLGLEIGWEQIFYPGDRLACPLYELP